jgi:hypothetical protein
MYPSILPGEEQNGAGAKGVYAASADVLSEVRIQAEGILCNGDVFVDRDLKDHSFGFRVLLENTEILVARSLLVI